MKDLKTVTDSGKFTYKGKTFKFKSIDHLISIVEKIDDLDFDSGDIIFDNVNSRICFGKSKKLSLIQFIKHMKKSGVIFEKDI